MVIDPITNLSSIASLREVKEVFTRLIDFLKIQGVTALFTSLISDAGSTETSDVEISSLMDSWILLRQIERDGERYRALHILKSRGMPHSHKVQPFRITDNGVQFINSDDDCAQRSTDR